METIEKPWGREEILARQDRYVVKRLHINKGCRCSLQYHKYKMETIYVLEGMLILQINSQAILVWPGYHYTIMPGEIHRMEGGALNGAVYLECSTTELDDVVRVEDDYDRQ